MGGGGRNQVSGCFPPAAGGLQAAQGLQKLGAPLHLQQFTLGTPKDFERDQPWSLWVRCPQETLEVCLELIMCPL